MARAVPTFSSFRPKSKPGSSKQTSSSRKIPQEIHGETRDGHAKKGDHAHHKREHRTRDRDSPVEPGVRREHDAHSSLSEPASGHFVTDLVGDEKNLTYQSLHKYDVSRYHRTGYGKVLGLPPYLKIDRELSTLSEVYVHSPEHEVDARTGLSSRQGRVTLSAAARRVLVLSSGKQDFLERDYVPLSTSRKRKRGTGSSRLDLADIRDITQKAEQSAESATDSESDESGGELNVEPHSINSASADRVRQQPQDLGAWQALIDHQTEMVYPGKEESALTTSQRRTIAELKLALCEKALEQVHDHQARLTIVRLKLKEGSHVWDEPTLRRKWQEVLDGGDADGSFWLQYVNTLQADASVGHETMKQTYVKLVGGLQAAVRRRQENEASYMDFAVAHLHMLLRLTRLVHQSGYIEMAIALWQGILHLNIGRSNRMLDFQERLSGLAELWDAEDRRIGESVDLMSITKADNGHDCGMGSQSDGKKKYARFAAQERILEWRFPLPGKTSDDVEDEAVKGDALHVVFFSDLEDILTVADLKVDDRLLLDAFLTLFGLPSLPLTGGELRQPWRDDAWLDLSIALNDQSDRPSPAIAGVPSPQGVVVSHSNVWSMFAQAATPSPALSDWIKNILRLFAQTIPDAKIYFLAFVASGSPKAALKEAKALLRRDPTDLSLYNATARIEALLDHEDKATHIWHGAIHMPLKSQTTNRDSSRTTAESNSVALLVHDSAMHEVTKGRESRARMRLASFRGESDAAIMETQMEWRMPVSTRLGLEQEFKAGFEDSLRRHERGAAITFASLALLLAYLESEKAIGAILLAVSAQIATVESIQGRTEAAGANSSKAAVHQTAAGIILLHMQHRKSYRPGELMPWLSGALGEHPANGVLLRLWYRLNTRITHLDGIVKGVRRPWLRVDGDAPTSTASAAISAELANYHARGEAAVPQAVRSLFERALLSKQTPTLSSIGHSPMLWRAWLDFEVKVARADIAALLPRKRGGDRPGEQLQKVFFGGLKALPWDKGWILRGLDIFDSSEPWALKPAELRSIYDTLLERELRIRQEI